MLTGHQGGPGRRADRTRGVGIGEDNASGCEPFQIRGAISPIEIGGFGTEGERDVLPPEVIHHEYDDIGPGWIRDFDWTRGYGQEYQSEQCGKGEMRFVPLVAMVIDHFHM